MVENKTADAFKYNLRLPRSLHKRLQRDAQKRRVSLNQQIVDELCSLQLQLSEQLRQQVERAAKEHSVSLSDEISSRLAWSFRRDAEQDRTYRMADEVLAGLSSIRKLEADLAKTRQELEADLAKTRQELGLPPREPTPEPRGIFPADFGQPKNEPPAEPAPSEAEPEPVKETSEKEKLC